MRAFLLLCLVLSLAACGGSADNAGLFEVTEQTLQGGGSGGGGGAVGPPVVLGPPDADRDGDGLSDNAEASIGTDPDDADTDDDTMEDGADYFPLAAGSTYYVTETGNDSNDCQTAATGCATLTFATQMAQSGDLVLIGPGTYTESGITLTTHQVTVRGDSAATTVLQAAASLAAATTLIFDVGPSTDARLEHMTLRHGAGAPGSAVYVGNATLVMDSCVVEANGTGGGIVTTGAIYNQSGDVVLLDTVVQDNAGTGMYLNGGDGYLLRASFERNGENGIIFFDGNGYIEGSLFQDNAVDGLNVQNSPEMFINASTFIGQMEGMFLVGFGDTRITNSSFYDNGTTIWTALLATMEFEHSTLEGNGAIVIVPGEPLTLHKTIVADTPCFGLGVAGSDNLIDDAGCGGSSNLGAVLGLEPMLADNGGPTPTYALQAASNAIDATPCGVLEADQRGRTRPSGVMCDIGAFERQPDD